MSYCVIFQNGYQVEVVASDLDEATALAIDQAHDDGYTNLATDHIEPGGYAL